MPGPETSVPRPLKCQERDTINEPTHSVHQRTAQDGAQRGATCTLVLTQSSCSTEIQGFRYSSLPAVFVSDWAEE